MMMDFSTIIVSVLLAVSVAGTENKNQDANSNPATKPTLPKKPFYNLLSFNEDNYREAFESLDFKNDKLIKTDELESHYYHKDSKFAIQKFIKLLDTSSTPESIDYDELKKFMGRDQVKRQVFCVNGGPTKEYRKKFYSDEILTYVYLVIDQEAIPKLFKPLDTDMDSKLNLNEIMNMEIKIGNGRNKLTEQQAKVIIAEMGGGQDTVAFQDFKEYLMDGELSFLFRECRKRIVKNVAEYDNACLIKKLIIFTTRRLTEYMKTLLFDALDAKTKNHEVDVEDIKGAFPCDDDKANKFINYMYGAKTGKIEYGYFRDILDIPPVVDFIVNECFNEKPTEIFLDQRITCMKWKLWAVVGDNFSPRFVGIPDLDLIFLFEDLDTNDNGLIEQKSDLESSTGRNWNTQLAKKFINELSPQDNDGAINLDDFFYYVYEPYMMTALAECQIAKESEKLSCYNHEMEDMITTILTKPEILDFFRFYVTKEPTKNDQKSTANQQSKAIQQSSISNNRQDITEEVISDFALGGITPKMTIEVKDNFLNELGMGNKYVNVREFKYYIKQQDPSTLFSTDDKTVPRNHFPKEQLHGKLLQYLEKFMTENNIQQTFKLIDNNNDYVIDKLDVDKSGGAVTVSLIENMAVYGNKDHASFQEFWLFLNFKENGKESRKRQLEKVCTQENHNDKLNCYKSNLKTVI